jgi:hypothetical protein
MSDEPKKRSRARIGWALLALFVLYPLSIGPATLFCHRAHIGDAWLAIPYGPIKWAMDSNQSIDSAFRAYVGLWVKMAAPKPKPR